MPALEDEIRAELADAADEGIPDMTHREIEALAIRLARRLRPLMLGQPGTAGRPGNLRRKAADPTKRQVEIVELLADGETYAGITERFGVHPNTVLRHVSDLATRWEVVNRPAVLVNAAFALSWLEVPASPELVAVDLRDRTALALLAAGREGEIEELLGLSQYRIGTQRARLMGLFGVSTDAALVAAAWRAGVLPTSGVAAAAEVAS